MTKVITLLFLAISLVATAQVNVQLTVTAADIATDCNDLFSDPDPFWSIAVSGGAEQIFGEDYACSVVLPLVAFDSTTACVAQIPTQLEVCFEVWEDDRLPFQDACDLVKDCAEQICQTFPVAPGAVDYTLELPDGGESSGTLAFNIAATGTPPSLNDAICNATDLGEVNFGTTTGNADQIIYDNLCGTAPPTEANPFDQGGTWENEAGVWFRFTTGADVGSFLHLNGISDTDEPIDLEIAVYESDNDACDGSLTLLREVRDESSNNSTVDLRCLIEPNRTYFVLVDGREEEPLRGRFGLEVVDFGFREGGDLRCDALDLGAVPFGGSVATPHSYSNFCADDVGDPFSPDFASQRSVWFQFQPPPTGHVRIEAISNPLFGLGAQLALYRSSNNTCSGFFLHVESAYSSGDLDEELVVQCLDPDRTYWLLVDGDGSNTTGIFDIVVSDNGDITPRTDLTETICAGEVFEVGSSDYTQSGVYSDTLSIPGTSCDSIVQLNLTVLDEITVAAFTSFPATGAGNADGQGSASATGGIGTYTFTWSSGQTGSTVGGLISDAQVCVTATDAAGCSGDTCFVVDFVEGILPTASPAPVSCNGGADGSFELTATAGLPPYNYSWANDALDIDGGGTLDGPTDSETVTGLPAGLYAITVSDAVFDTTFTIEITQPAVLEILPLERTDPLCFEDCTGVLEVAAQGGNGVFQFNWSDGLEPTNFFNDLCAGSYTLTVTDAKGCTATQTFLIDEPAEFVATASEQQSVSCFAGADGVVSVSATEPPQTYLWQTGDTTATVTDLPAGGYSVTVTNASGCVSTATAEVTEPDAPLAVQILETTGIACGGDANGVLSAQIDGPGSSFTYVWSNAATTATTANLSAGSYALTITNERGCTAQATYELTEPDPLVLKISATDLTCLDTETDGSIEIDSLGGGVGPYTVRLGEQGFGNAVRIANLAAGAYTVEVEDANGCTLTADATIQPPPEVLLELNGPTEIRLGDAVEISALTSTAQPVYTWTANQPFAFTDSLFRDEISARPLEEFFVTATVTDTTNSCSATASFSVRVNTERRVFLPNAFSPNDDGQNDRFGPSAGPDVEVLRTFRVFDRYGSLVFERFNLGTNDPNDGWDGSFRGQRLRPGVFVWQLEVQFVDGRTEWFAGDVALLR